MRVDWAVTCRYAESDGSVGTIVGAGIDVLYAPDFPHQVSIMLAVRLAAAFEEVNEGQEHEIVVRVMGPGGGLALMPDGSEAQPLTLRFAAAGKQLVPGWVATLLFALAVQWWATEEGAYTLEVGVDNGPATPTPVHVLRAPAIS